MNQDKENLLSGYHIVKNFNNNKEKKTLIKLNI
jgi:hypothetical protein